MNICKQDEFLFLVLNNKSDWDKGLPYHITITDKGLELEKTFQFVRQITIQSGDLPRDFEIIDFSVGLCHIIYILEKKSHAVWVYDAIQKRVSPTDCSGELFIEPVAIAFSPETFYVAESKQEERIFALDQPRWQIRWTISKDSDAEGNALGLAHPLEPVDIAVDQNENLYVLDSANHGIVKFNNIGRFDSFFGENIFAGKEPVTIALSPDGFLYVLERHDKKVIKFSINGTLENDNLISFEFIPSGLVVDKEGNLYIGDSRKREQDQNTGEEDDRFIRKYSPLGESIGIVPGYRGSVGTMAVDEESRIYIFSEEDRQFAVLNPESQFLTPENEILPTGKYFSRSLDSTKSATKWHKLLIKRTIPENTQIRISYLISDEKLFTIDGGKKDLDRYIEETILIEDEQEKLVRIEKLDSFYNNSAQFLTENPKDALLSDSNGRYLWIRVELIGGELHSPVVESIQAWFPRLSYLRYLPALYQEDEGSRDFLDRFLSLFETFFSSMENQINHVVRYFDPDVVSGEFLHWLSSWLAVSIDENWTEDKIAILLKRVSELYKNRGTRYGIEEMITIFTNEKPLIIEFFQILSKADPEKQKILDKLFEKDPFCFYVFLKPYQVKNEEERKAVQRIIESEKPAHTFAKVQVLQPWFYLDRHTYLGVNTHLSKPYPRLDFGSAIPRDTVLTDSIEQGQRQISARLDRNMTLI